MRMDDDESRPVGDRVEAVGAGEQRLARLPLGTSGCSAAQSRSAT